eukprot:5163048-Amphidinium_carterae.2
MKLADKGPARVLSSVAVQTCLDGLRAGMRRRAIDLRRRGHHPRLSRVSVSTFLNGHQALRIIPWSLYFRPCNGFGQGQELCVAFIETREEPNLASCEDCSVVTLGAYHATEARNSFGCVTRTFLRMESCTTTCDV